MDSVAAVAAAEAAVRPGAGSWRELTGWAVPHGYWLQRRHFGPAALKRMAEAIAQGETRHHGELVVAIEAALPPHVRDSRERALEVFGRLRVWDTPQRTGVLLYLALGEHRIELVADRGVAADDQVWNDLCEQIRRHLRARPYLDAMLSAIAAIETELAGRCPPREAGDETGRLPDTPVLL